MRNHVLGTHALGSLRLRRGSLKVSSRSRECRKPLLSHSPRAGEEDWVGDGIGSGNAEVDGGENPTPLNQEFNERIEKWREPAASIQG